MDTPSPLNVETSAGFSSPPPSRHPHRRLGILVIAVLIVGILSGGYVLARQGWLLVPGVTPDVADVFAAAAGGTPITSGQYTITITSSQPGSAPTSRRWMPVATAWAHEEEGQAAAKGIVVPETSDVQMSLTIDGQFTQQPTPAAAMRVKGILGLLETDTPFDLEVRQIETAYFARASQLPNVPLLTDVFQVNQWYALELPTPLASVPTTDSKELLTALQQAASETKPAMLRRLPGTKAVGSTTATRYQLSIDPEAVPKFLEATANRLPAEQYQDVKTAIQELLQDHEQREQIHRFADTARIELWIADDLFVGGQIEIPLVSSTEDATPNVIIVTLQLRDLNAPQTIEPVTDAKSLTDVFAELTGELVEEVSDGLSTDPLPSTPPADTDSDGLSDEQERALGTNPASADSDGDGFPDKTEVDSGHDPLK